MRRGPGRPRGRVTGLRGGSGHRLAPAPPRPARRPRLPPRLPERRLLGEAVRLDRRRPCGPRRPGPPGLVRPDHGAAPPGRSGKHRGPERLVRAVPRRRRVGGPPQGGARRRAAVVGRTGPVHRHIRAPTGPLGHPVGAWRGGDLPPRPPAPERPGRPGRTRPPRLGQRRTRLGGTGVRTRRVRLVRRQRREHRLRAAPGPGLPRGRWQGRPHRPGVLLDALRHRPELHPRAGRDLRRPRRDRRPAGVRGPAGRDLPARRARPRRRLPAGRRARHPRAPRRARFAPSRH